ncbi:MAG TPA: hypothetical protein VN088_01310 [Nocardioides sp.]|nr:hypothetical protein [Nocardioides sp.]
MRALLSLASTAAAAILLAGCGSGGDTATDPASVGTTAASSSPTAARTTPAALNLPACASVWKVGATLPARYKGCQVNGVKGRSIVYQCEIGSRVASYGTDLYAILGRKVTKASPSLQGDADWKYLYNHCVG